MSQKKPATSVMMGIGCSSVTAQAYDKRKWCSKSERMGESITVRPKVPALPLSIEWVLDECLA